MFHTIIAGCDGYDRGLAAVRFASTLAEAIDARLVLAAAHVDPPVPFPTTFRERAAERDAAIRRVRDELAPTATTTTIATLSPAHALRHAAEIEHADLIVVGSRHRSRVGRIVEVDHALQVLHGAPSAVTVVPDGADVAPRLSRIAVGIDGSSESRAALALAVDLARRVDARLWLQVVVEDRLPAWSTTAPGFVPPVDWSAWLEDRQQDARTLLEQSLAGIVDVPADGNVSVGHPARDLASVGSWSDLLIVGSRHWGVLGRLALGSTSEGVVRRAAGPVLVLPRLTVQSAVAPERAVRTTAL